LINNRKNTALYTVHSHFWQYSSSRFGPRLKSCMISEIPSTKVSRYQRQFWALPIIREAGKI